MSITISRLHLKLQYTMENIKLILFKIFITLFYSLDFINSQCISNTTRIFLSDLIYNISGTDSLTVDKLHIFQPSLSKNNTKNITLCSGLSDKTLKTDCHFQHVSIHVHIQWEKSVFYLRPVRANTAFDIFFAFKC